MKKLMLLTIFILATSSSSANNLFNPCIEKIAYEYELYLNVRAKRGHQESIAMNKLIDKQCNRMLAKREVKATKKEKRDIRHLCAMVIMTDNHFPHLNKTLMDECGTLEITNN